MTACCAVLLAGCAQSDSVVKSFQDPSFGGGAFAKILIVGAHENVNARRHFEEALGAELTAAGTAAASSLAVMGVEAAINRENLVAAAQRSDADAVIITRLLDMEARAEIGGGRVAADAERKDNGLADFFRYDYVTYRDPLEITTIRTVWLATDLYNVADEAKIWSVQSTSFDKETLHEIVESAARAISHQLARDGPSVADGHRPASIAAAQKALTRSTTQ
jgi:hypothetical protein